MAVSLTSFVDECDAEAARHGFDDDFPVVESSGVKIPLGVNRDDALLLGREVFFWAIEAIYKIQL